MAESGDGTAAGHDGPDPAVPESAFARRNRNFAELLQELRVVQTGVQILFAFLLTLPFSNRFDTLTTVDRVVYVVTTVSAAGATAFLIAPVSYHRLVFRAGRKAEVLSVASRMAELGLIALLVAVTGALYLAMAVVMGAFAGLVAAAVAGLYVTLWYLLPFVNRWRVRQRPPADPTGGRARG